MKSLNFKDFSTKAAYLISVFLFEVADLLMLFALPVFIFTSIHSIILTGFLMLLRPLGRTTAYILFKRNLQERNFVFLTLLAYALTFLLIIGFNRFLSFTILLFAIYILGMAKEFLALAVIKVEFGKSSFILGGSKKFLDPSMIFAALSISFFGSSLVAKYQFQDLQNYFSLLIATSAVLFYYFICKEHSTQKQNVLFPKATRFLSPSLFDLNLSVVLVEGIKAIFWVLFPVYIIMNLQLDPSLIYILPAFYAPLLVLHILKNTFLFRYWKVRTFPRMLLFSIVLISFVFAQETAHLLLLAMALGLAVGSIEISSWYQEERSMSYLRNLNSSSLGFILGALIGAMANNFLSLPLVLTSLGVILFLITLLLKLLSFKKHAASS